MQHAELGNKIKWHLIKQDNNGILKQNDAKKIVKNDIVSATIKSS